MKLPYKFWSFSTLAIGLTVLGMTLALIASFVYAPTGFWIGMAGMSILALSVFFTAIVLVPKFIKNVNPTPDNILLVQALRTFKSILWIIGTYISVVTIILIVREVLF